MECKECNEKLAEMIQGELTDEANGIVQEHLAGCTERRD